MSKDVMAAKNAAKDAYDNLLDATEKFKSVAMQAGIDARDKTEERIEHSVEKTQDKAVDAYVNTQNFVIDRPLTSVGIAFATGYLAARILGR
ncbi:MAG: hypothetical protein R3F41_10215 [Gammaproteobacteria bacterium]|nr:hypothetical protein [Pseudomonadales bacterium]